MASDICYKLARHSKIDDSTQQKNSKDLKASVLYSRFRGAFTENEIFEAGRGGVPKIVRQLIIYTVYSKMKFHLAPIVEFDSYRSDILLSDPGPPAPKLKVIVPRPYMTTPSSESPTLGPARVVSRIPFAICAVGMFI